jgi:butanol dehydrogenase
MKARKNMDNFIFDNATKIYFGKDQVKVLPSILENFGKNVLLVYGGGSIKRSGLYDTILELLYGYTIIECANVEPNPHHTTVQRGADLCKTHHIDVILAVGGGSVIDAAKVMGAGAYYDGPIWDMVVNPSLIKEVVPIVSVLTLSGTGSEMNRGSVITNTELNIKKGTGGQNSLPYASIIDPTYMMTLPPYQTAAGAIDAFSHAIENYFKADNDAFMQDAISEAVMKAVIKYAPIALKEPTNYQARANLAWASTLALNGLTGVGKPGPWAVHAIEHELSAYHDLTHGIGLGILIPVWLGFILEQELMPIFVRYGINVWGINPNQDDSSIAYQAIDKTIEFFKSLNAPLTLSEVNIDSTHFVAMAKSAVKLGRLNQHLFPLDENDVMMILNQCL